MSATAFLDTNVLLYADDGAESVSLNKAALMLLKKGAGLNETGSSSTVIGSAFDRFIGRWSEDDEKRLIESIASCEAVDEALWK